MTGILFLARMGSTRLPNKHLIEVNGKSFLEWMILRFANEFESEINENNVKLILATSTFPENQRFELAIKSLPISVFYGDNDNIPKRQLECAKENGLKTIISIDGDDILCSTKGARRIYELLLNPQKNIAKTIGLPLGMNSMGYQTQILQSALNNFDGKLETGWGRIFNDIVVEELCYNLPIESKSLRMTLDYTQDADFFSKTISHFKDKIISVNDEELITEILNNNFGEINGALNDEYWENFNKQKNVELSN
jgi:spore coat polysaccharide biosynthesis protein SpsF (cytidylyltransferase family)